MKRVALVLLVIALALPLLGYRNAVTDPVVRHGNVGFQNWPKGTPPIGVALLSDIHVQGPDLPPERMARIVEQVNRERPDLVLIAGDFSGDRTLRTRLYAETEIAVSLKGLKAPLGVYAVLGNHDHWRDGPAMRRAVSAAGIPVLVNQAIRAGPLTIAGADDIHTGNADIEALTRAAAALPGPTVVLSHSPDIAPALPPRFGLVLAGHTHCGQIVLPLIGRLATASRYGERYACGMIREPGRTTIVSAGIGNSVLPFRFGAPPDFWMIRMGPLPR
ncbi:metallophosphoesterase [Sphingomonas sp. LT1P40]|uniref:metallophosphoesterase n=1 Tax=Alteristakelama amylovorans TaxID=3096166 RepID=UPI002FCC6DC3